MFISKNDTFRSYRQALSLFKSSQGIHLEEPTYGCHGVEAEDRGFDIRSGGWGGGGGRVRGLDIRAERRGPNIAKS